MPPTPLRCKTLGHEWDYLKMDGKFVKACERCGTKWEDIID